MRNKYYCLLLCCLFLYQPSGFAQKAKLRKANYLMEALRYDEAIEVFGKILKNDEENAEAIIGSAVAYRKSGNWLLAEEFYTKVIQLSTVQASDYFYYGQILLQTDQCEAAQLAFNSFLRLKPYDTRKVFLEDVCTYKEELFKTGAQRIQIDLPDFNASGSDIGPAFYNDGIVFGSVRSEGKQAAFYDLYYTQPASFNEENGVITSYDPIRNFSAILNSDFNDAIITFSPDKSEVYFTRNNDQELDEKFIIRRLEIYRSQKDSLGRWGLPQSLQFNSPDHSSAHPALSPDGNRLFFSSDRPGGFGGKDIYFCERIGNIWSAPVNLGPAINTEGDELFPFYHSSKELYFTSDGHLGLGGKDVLRAEDLGDGNWSTVENLGAPLNSAFDDFGLILNNEGTYGFFTSNRPGGYGKDDIYAFRPRQVFVEIQFVDANERKIRKNINYTTLSDFDQLESNRNGLIQTWLPFNECLRIGISDENYRPEERQICAIEAELKDTIQIRWPLMDRMVEAPVNEPIVLEETEAENNTMPVNYLKGWVNNELTGAPVANVRLVLRSAECDETFEVQTDDRGGFIIPWKMDCCYELLTSKSGFFTKNWHNSLCAIGNRAQQEITISIAPYRLSKDQILTQSANDSDQKGTFKVGLQTYDDESAAIPYLLNIYYDLGRASVRAEAIPELNKLHDLLIDNPEILLEISSHTDAQGPSTYNERLSQRRANAIVKWLISKGIKADRVVGRGYGETRLVNNCSDNVNCQEEEHQANRRTEFRVLEGN